VLMQGTVRQMGSCGRVPSNWKASFRQQGLRGDGGGWGWECDGEEDTERTALIHAPGHQFAVKSWRGDGEAHILSFMVVRRGL
jgi:hypothetical protein